MKDWTKPIKKYLLKSQNKLPSNFLILKSIDAKFDENEDLEVLLEKHEELMKIFRNWNGKNVKEKKKNLLDLKIAIALKILEKCKLCEWKCKVNRIKGNVGVCKVPAKNLISSEFVHMGEESYFIPSHTIFFWSCNMYCVFCQNYTISQRLEEPIEIKPVELAKIIEKRRIEGCRNVNFVGGEPTPYLPFILETMKYVKTNVPVIWNSNMYMSEISMKLLEGVVDVYLADFKFGPGKCSEKYTKVRNYWEIVTRNLLLAKNQNAEIVIRHLILPNHVKCCSEPILRWISQNLKENVIVNLMDQYYPCFRAFEFKEIARKITKTEFEEVLKLGEKLGIIIKD